MLPLRLVLDTNVIVSGALKPKGLERTTMIFAVTRPARLYVSPDIMAEYVEVLRRPALRVHDEERRSLLDLLAARSQQVVPSSRVFACLDPDDNIFLECAEAAAADYLVTGNKRHFPAFWKHTKIVNCRETMEIIAPHLRPW